MAAIITLTTDFGLTEGYVAMMKGVILTINPTVTLVDITHRITPQNIEEAAFVLSTVYSYFPPQTIHLVIVDPGVGTGRKAIILRTPVADFVAPDNGVLSYVIQRFANELYGSIPEAVAITNPKYWRSPVSHTFHGRDIMAPVAAHLSLGLPLTEFGEPVSSLTTLPLTLPYRSPDGSLTGEVIHIDSFGNLITNIRETDLPEGTLQTEICGRLITGLSRTYAEGKRLLALIGSHGYLEISVKDGNASIYLQAKLGSKVKVSLITSL